MSKVNSVPQKTVQKGIIDEWADDLIPSMYDDKIYYDEEDIRDLKKRIADVLNHEFSKEVCEQNNECKEHWLELRKEILGTEDKKTCNCGGKPHKKWCDVYQEMKEDKNGN